MGGRGGVKLPRGGSQNDKLMRTLALEVRNDIHYGKEALRVAQQALREFEALKEGGEGESSPAAKRRRRELHRQTLTERETERIDRSRERNLFMNLTSFVVIASVCFGALTAIFMVLTAKYAQPWGYTCSGIGLALTALTGAVAPRWLLPLFSPARSELVGPREEA